MDPEIDGTTGAVANHYVELATKRILEPDAGDDEKPIEASSPVSDTAAVIPSCSLKLEIPPRSL